MNILLTGSEGFVGRELLPQLSDHSITCFDFCDMNQATPEAYEKALAEKAGDESFDVVIHVGAIALPQFVDPVIFHWNTRCSQIIFERYVNSKIIFISSNMARFPINLYGWSKYLSERLLEKIATNYCILRPSAIFGEPYNRRNSLPIVDLIASGKAEKLFLDYTRDFIHVGDIARAIKIAVDKDMNGVFNLGTGIPYTAIELADFFGCVDIPIVDRPDTVPARLLADEPLFPFGWELLDPMDYLEEKILLT